MHIWLCHWLGGSTGGGGGARHCSWYDGPTWAWINCPAQMLVVPSLRCMHRVKEKETKVWNWAQRHLRTCGLGQIEVTRMRTARIFSSFVAVEASHLTILLLPVSAIDLATVCFVSVFKGACGEVVGMPLVLFLSPPRKNAPHPANWMIRARSFMFRQYQYAFGSVQVMAFHLPSLDLLGITLTVWTSLWLQLRNYPWIQCLPVF